MIFFFFCFLNKAKDKNLFVRNCRKAPGFFKEEVCEEDENILFNYPLTSAIIFRLVHYSQCHRPKSRK